MASSLFGANPVTSPLPINPQAQLGSQNQNNDAVNLVTDALAKSNGDAKAAFYSMAQEKGVDPDQFIRQLNSMGDPKALMMSMMQSNPKVGNLLKLFGAMR